LQQRLQSEGLDFLLEGRDLALGLRAELRVGLGGEQLFQLGGAPHARRERFVGIDPPDELLLLLDDGLDSLLVTPKVRGRHLRLQPGQRGALRIQVKGTSGDPPNARSAAAAGGRAPFPPSSPPL
jgi:hypothetical protein